MVSHQSLIPGLPVLVTERIFSFLPLKDRLSCRLVCSEWYSTILKIGKYPNCYVIDASQPKNQNGWQYFNQRKSTELKKGFLMKNYEDSLSPVEVLQIQNLNILKWERSFRNSNAFQGTARNVTELHLKKIMFSSGKTLIKFLNKFEKLRHLAIHYCEFEYHLLFGYLKYMVTWSKYNSYADSLIDLLPQLISLDVELAENSCCMGLLIYILQFKIKESTLKSLTLKVLPAEQKFPASLFKKYLKMDIFNTNIVSHINMFIKNMLAIHQKSLKSLNITWKSLMNRGITLSANNNYYQIPPLSDGARALFSNFEEITEPDCDLNLENLSLNIGSISTTPAFSLILINDARPVGLEASFLLFLLKQIQKGLHIINLSQASFMPFPVFGIEEFENLDMTMTHPEKSIRLNYDFEFISSGTHTSLLAAYWIFCREPLPKLLKITRVEKLKVSIRNETSNSEEVAENFREYLWLNYLLNVLTNPKSYECYNGKTLKELQISCNMRHLKSYNISTICFHHPNITVLKIVDGPEFSYREGKNNSLQYEGMSKATIDDYDLKFILKCIQLKEIVIWANMSTLSDRGLLGFGNFPEADTVEPLNWKKNEDYEQFKDLLWFCKVKRSDFSKRKLSSVSISNLKELKVLSLRGVGKEITDAVALSKDGLCGLKKLSSLEILGDHNITERGQDMLHCQGIKRVRLK